MIKTISIILSSLATLAVVLAIIFEGNFKKKPKKETSPEGNIKKIKWITRLLKIFKSEIFKLTALGWIILIISVLMSIGNGVLTTININESYEQQTKSNDQHTKDTIRSNTLQKTLNDTRIQAKLIRYRDSVQIMELKNNSDSLRKDMVDAAVRAMNEQKKIIEKEKENVFTHFQNEIEDNLRKTLINYDRKAVIGYRDTSLFIATRLNNTYLKKAESISQNTFSIDCLMETSELIERVNSIADKLLDYYPNDAKGKSDRHLNIRMFLANVELLQNYLYILFNRVINLNSYKEFESIELGKSISDLEKAKIKYYILNNPASIKI